MVIMIEEIQDKCVYTLVVTLARGAIYNRTTSGMESLGLGQGCPGASE